MFAKWVGPLFWLAMGAAAVGVLYMEWRHPPRLPTPIVADTPPAVTVPPPKPFKPQPLVHYAEIVARPVFIDARRPEEDEPPEPPAAPPPEPDHPLDLIGVLLVPGAAAALLRPTEPKNAPVLRIAQGETVDGWQLQSVSADRVVLRKGPQVRELVLKREPSPPQPPTPGRMVPSRVQPAPSPPAPPPNS